MDAHLPHCTTCLKPLVSGWDCGEHASDAPVEACDHSSQMHGGNVTCSKCGWVYRIGLTGSRWVEPGYEPPSLAVVIGG